MRFDLRASWPLPRRRAFPAWSNRAPPLQQARRRRLRAQQGHPSAVRTRYPARSSRIFRTWSPTSSSSTQRMRWEFLCHRVPSTRHASELLLTVYEACILQGRT